MLVSVENEILICKLYTAWGSEFTQQLAFLYQKALSAMIEYCSNLNVVEYTPSDFAQVQGEEDLARLPLYSKRDPYAWFDMTEIQKVYLLGRLGNYEIGNISNHIYNEYVYRDLDVRRLENVLNQLIQEHPVLRTIYSFERLQQRFLQADEIEPYHIKLNDYSSVICEEKHLAQAREALSHKVYNPEQFPLFTFEVSQFQDCYLLHISIDLILLDAHSRQSLFVMMNAMYRDPDFKPSIPDISFKDYQDYYQLLKHSSWYQRDKSYWMRKIPQMPSRLTLPFKTSPELVEHPRFIDSTRYIDKALWQQFKSQARKYGVSYSSVLLGLYGSVLSYFSGYNEFLITMTLFNRYAIHPEVNALWGDFTSTNLFHFERIGTDLLKTLQRTHQVMWDDIQHALYTGMDVQRELGRHHKLNGNKAVSPIVFTGIVGDLLDETEAPLWLEDNEMTERRYWSGQTSQAWIDLQAIEVNGQFMSKWLYVDQLFDKSYMDSLNAMYCKLITHLALNDWETSVSLFELPEQDQRIIHEANADTQPLTQETLLSGYEETQHSDTIAVIEGGTGSTFSYARLWADSDKLAHVCLDQAAGQQRLVAILSEKGYYQVVAACAIMRSGQAYLPLHIDWPLGRIEAVLKEGGVHVYCFLQSSMLEVTSIPA